MIELTPEQLWIVGAVASVLSVAVRFLAARFGFSLGKGAMTVVVAVISFALAAAFNVPALPAYVDPVQFVGDWVALLASFVGPATVIYNLLLDKVLDRFGLTAQRFLK